MLSGDAMSTNLARIRQILIILPILLSRSDTLRAIVHSLAVLTKLPTGFTFCTSAKVLRTTTLAKTPPAVLFTHTSLPVTTSANELLASFAVLNQHTAIAEQMR